MNLISVEQFAANRTVDQEGLEEALRPTVERWLTDEETHWADLKEVIEAAYAEVYEAQGGTKEPTSGNFLRQVKTALGKGGEPDEHTVDRITVWLATGILNSATISAAKHDPDEISLQWVTMHDDKVREAHRDAEGQVRAPTEFYDVDGHKMRYPGDPSAPIELWINCRCTLAPVKTESVAAGGETVQFISEKPWSGSASRFTPEQWKKSCIMHVCDGMEKSCHKLPIREPGGELSRAGVHAAASRINQTDGPAEAKASAKRALRGAYRQLGEEVPDNLAAALEGDDDMPEDEVETEETTEEQAEVGGPIPWYGALAPEGKRSGDGRKFTDGSLTGRPLPLPLKWQKVGDDGHKGDVVVGRIDRMWRHEGAIRADGVMLTTPEADEFIGLMVDFGGKFGVSVDADDAEMEFDEEADEVSFTKARIAGATGVAIPAFHEAFVAIGEWGEDDQPGDDADYLGIEEQTEEDEQALVASVGAPLVHLFKRGAGWITDPVATKRIHDYWTKPGQEGYAKIGWGTGGDFNRCRVLVGEKIAENSPEDMRFINNICAQWHHDALGIWPAEHLKVKDPEGDMAPAVSLVASAGFCAPSEWFAKPEIDRDAPGAVKVTEEGRVFGYLAEWDTCHMQFTGVCITPPPSSTDYAYFLTGEMLTDAGPVPVGRISLGGGHAPGTMRWRPASEHYDSTSAQVAYVTCGEDDRGIWLAGMVKPGTTEEQIMEFRASPLSGDWRKVGHNLELIAALAVNSGGFPVPRVNIFGGEQVSLVAAGMLPMPEPETFLDAKTIAAAVIAELDAREQRKQKMKELAESMGV